MNTNLHVPKGSNIHTQLDDTSTNAGKTDYVVKDGKTYKVEVQTIHHDLAWKVWQAVQVFFLTVFSLGIGFGFQAFRDKWKEKWDQAITGDEKVTVYTRYSPQEDPQTLKTNRIGASLQPEVELPLEVRKFIQEARKDITKISINDLEKGLKEALKVATDIKNSEDKTTILTVAERVAYSYVKAKNFAKAFEVRMQVAQAITPADPLANLQVALQKEHPKIGIKLHPVDTSLFKNHSLGVQKRKFTDGTTQLHFNAKLSHPTRQKLTNSIDGITANPKQLFNALPKDFCKSVKVSSEQTSYEGRKDAAGGKWTGDFSHNIGEDGFRLSSYGKCYSKVIEFEGVGKVKIATSSDFRAEFNRITIDLDPTISEAKAAEKLNIIFSALGLGAVSSSSRTEDIERIKIMQLFRAFYPQQAYDFERNDISFEESVESLKTRIGNKVPHMKGKFQHYLVDHQDEMYQQEIYPGQPVWCVKGISSDVKKAGGIGLVAGVTADSFTDATKRFISMLNGGALSTQDRFELGIIAAGDSSSQDLKSGGGDSVFVRMITQGMSKNLDAYPLSGKMQILYDLDLVERVGYVYSGDKYGTKDPDDYQKRSTVTELVKEIENNPNNYKGNEICIHHRVGPEFIKGVRVNNKEEKEELTNVLRIAGFITKNERNQDCFNGILLDQFIRVGDVKAEYWA